ncbi:thioredoxin family protein [Rhodanobacter lindaniclasticus]
MTDTTRSSHVFDIDQQTFETEVLQASMDTPILVDFWAAWCEPCKSLGPILEKAGRRVQRRLPAGQGRCRRAAGAEPGCSASRASPR